MALTGLTLEAILTTFTTPAPNGGIRTYSLSLGLAKDFRINERVVFKFESSFTNLPNHPNFDDPRNNLTESVNGQGTFGKVLASRVGDAGGNRVGQFALRIEF